MNIYALAQLINTILFFSAGLFVYLHDRNKDLNRAFWRFCFFVSLWTLCYVIWQVAGTYDQGLFWSRALHVGAVLIPPACLHHVLLFLGEGKDRKKILFVKIGYVVSISFLTIVFTPLFIRGVKPALIFPYWPVPGPIYFLWIIHYLVYIIYSGYRIRKNYVASSFKAKDPLLYVLHALIIAYGGGGTNFFLFYDVPIPPIGNFLCAVYPLTVAWVILRHNLFGIQVIIRKGLVYSMLGAFITSVFFAIMLVVEKFSQRIIGYQALLLTVGFGFLLAFSFNPLKECFQKFVDRRFFRGTLMEIATENERLRREMVKQDQMKAVATLAASMAHEIKNPLTVISTFTEFLPERHCDKSFVNNFARLVKPQVEKINFIVQQLLDFSKPSPPKLRAVNIYQILNETAELLNNDFLSHRIKTEIQFFDKDIIISADVNQLKQVFINLFLNAIDAMPNGGALAVSIGHNHDNVADVRIQDTGHGISKENLKRVFQPFFTTKSNGTGLGLSIVKDILEQHKASIRAESEIDKGTKFIIRFPIVTQSVTCCS